MKNRIKEIRLKKNMTANDVAERAGTTFQQISRLERGERSLDTEWIEKISKALSVNPIELLPKEWQPKGIKTIKVVGYVQAGLWQEARQWSDDESYDIMIPHYEQYEYKHIYALEVRGESMNEVFPNGTCVVCVPINEWDAEIENGKRVIVERTNPEDSTVEATVKEFFKTETGIFLIPKSTDPQFDRIKIDETTGDCQITGVVIGSYRKE